MLLSFKLLATVHKNLGQNDQTKLAVLYSVSIKKKIYNEKPSIEIQNFPCENKISSVVLRISNGQFPNSNLIKNFRITNEIFEY